MERARGHARGEEGMTLLEMLVSCIVFMLLATQLSSLSINHFGHLRYLLQRSSIDREALIARRFLLTDMSQADNAQLSAPEQLRLNYGGASPHYVLYFQTGNNLMRQDSAANSTITAARYLAGTDFSLAADQTLTANLTFQRGIPVVALNLTMKWPA
jgi:hypothetical protein